MAKLFDIHKWGGIGLLNSIPPTYHSEDIFDSISGEAANVFDKKTDGLGWAYDPFYLNINTLLAKHCHKTLTGITTQLSGRFMVRFSTVGAGALTSIIEHFTTGAAAGYVRLRLWNDAGVPKMFMNARRDDYAYATVGAAVPISLNTRYQVIYRFVQNTANGAEWELWSEDGQTQIGTTQTAAFTTYNGSSTPDYRVGHLDASAQASTYRVSRLAIWDDYTLPAKLAAQVNIWQGTTSSWNTAGNWSLGRVPLSTDIVQFDGTSVQSCTLDINAVGRMMRVTSAYSGNFSQAGFSLTLDGSLDYQGTGTFDGDSSLLSVVGHLNFDAGMTALSLNAADIDFNYTGNFPSGQTPDSGDRIATFDIGGAAVCSTGQSWAVRKDGATSITLGNSNSRLYMTSGTIAIYSNGTCKPIEDNGGRISAVTGNAMEWRQSATSEITLPKIDSGSTMVQRLMPGGGTVGYTLSNAFACKQLDFDPQSTYTGTMTVDLNGKTLTISTGSLNIQAVHGTNVATLTVNVNGGAIISTGTASVINFSADSGATVNFNLGSGSLRSDIGALNFSATGTLNIDLGSGTVEVRAGITIGASTNFTRGTSLLKLTTNSQSLTSNGKQLYNVQADGVTKTMTFPDILNCNRLLVEPGTTINWKEGVTHVIADYTSGDWDGTLGNLVTFISGLSGTRFSLTNPASMTVSYMDIKDSNASNAINAWNGTNTNSGNNDAEWVFTEPAVIGSISPNSGTESGGTSVTITGTGFRATQGAGGVTIGGVAATIVSWSDTSISITTPAGSPGSEDVVVTNSDSQSDTEVGGFTYLTQPDLISVTPGSGPVAGGTPVTLAGTGFGAVQGSGSVDFNGSPLTISTWSDTAITGITTAHLAGVIDVTVTNDDGISDTLVNGFTYSGASAGGGAGSQISTGIAITI